MYWYLQSKRVRRSELDYSGMLKLSIACPQYNFHKMKHNYRLLIALWHMFISHSKKIHKLRDIANLLNLILQIGPKYFIILPHKYHNSIEISLLSKIVNVSDPFFITFCFSYHLLTKTKSENFSGYFLAPLN